MTDAARLELANSVIDRDIAARRASREEWTHEHPELRHYLVAVILAVIIGVLDD